MADGDPEQPRRHTRFHGRMEAKGRLCAHGDCEAPGEFRAPGEKRPGSDGPGDWRWLCLDHVREFNTRYNFFNGMSPDEIVHEQRPFAGWERETRAFAANGADRPPPWSDFHDPLDAIGARFRRKAEEMRQRDDGKPLTGENRRDLQTMGLGPDANRRDLRQRYADLVRQYHPDRNGGDRTHERALQDVIAAYTRLKGAVAFA